MRLRAALGQQTALPVAYWFADYRLGHEFLANALVLYIDDRLALPRLTQRMSKK